MGGRDVTVRVKSQIRNIEFYPITHVTYCHPHMYVLDG